MNNILKISIGIIIGGMLAAGATWYILNKLHEKELASIKESYSSEMELVKEERDSIAAYADSIDVVLSHYRALADSFAIVDLENQAEIDRLEMGLKEALKEVSEATYDENYNFLQETYITNDTLQYGFSGEQVSSIVVDLTEAMYTSSILKETKEAVDLLRTQMAISDETIQVLSKDRERLNNLTNILYTRIEEQAKENRMKDEEIAALKKSLRAWKTGAISAGAFIVLALILL